MEVSFLPMLFDKCYKLPLWFWCVIFGAPSIQLFWLLYTPSIHEIVKKIPSHTLSLQHNECTPPLVWILYPHSPWHTIFPVCRFGPNLIVMICYFIVYTDAEVYNDHISICLEGKKLFKCKYCPKQFSRRSGGSDYSTIYFENCKPQTHTIWGVWEQ